MTEPTASYCPTCGYTHLDDIKEVDYSESYFETSKPDMLERIEEDLAWWRFVYDHRLRLLEGYSAWYSRVLLDVGAGYGHFAWRAHLKGWAVSAVEPGDLQRQYIEDSKIKAYETIEDYKSKASAITLFEVLEHLEHPVGMLKQAWDKLDMGGLLMVQVPWDYNILQRKVAKREYWVVSPWHINYFNKVTLTNLLERHGFKVIHGESTFPMELFQMIGYNYPDNPEQGRECHKVRMALELAMGEEMYSKACRFYYQNDIGRDLLVMARKV